MPTDPSSEWEQVRRLTLDQFVTWTKFRGSAFTLSGHTTPEHWPFAVFIGIGSTPANEVAVELVRDCGRELERRGAPKTGRTNPDSLAGGIRWAQQTVHQAHHDGPLDSCAQSTCVHLRTLAVRAGDLG